MCIVRTQVKSIIMENTQAATNVAKDNAIKFGKLVLECMSCTPTELGDGFILKLQHKDTKEMKTPFGKKVQPVQHTFYMKVAEECQVGFKAEMNLDTMRIVEREFEMPEDADNAGEIVMLKWLHLN